jgi:hypothetical protein
MSEKIFKHLGHEVLTEADDYLNVRGSEKCRLCGCSWDAAEMLFECEVVKGIREEGRVMSDLSMEPWEQGPAECEAEITALRAKNETLISDAKRDDVFIQRLASANQRLKRRGDRLKDELRELAEALDLLQAENNRHRSASKAYQSRLDALTQELQLMRSELVQVKRVDGKRLRAARHPRGDGER